MLVSSAVRRGKSSSAVSLPVASHPVGDGGLPKASTKADAALNAQIDNAAAVLRGCYPHGFQENTWNGDEEDIGATHTKGLKAWFQTQAGLVGVIHHRKAWGKAFPGLNKASIDGVLKKISAVRKFVLKKKKKKNSITGARMQPWVRELLDVLNAPSQRGSGASSSRAPPTPEPPTPPGSPASTEAPAIPFSQPESIVSICSSAVACSEGAVSSTVASLSGLPKAQAKAANILHKPAAAKKTAAVKKKPATVKPVQKLGNAWKESPSFGFVKPIKATAKSYIQFKEGLGGTFSLLVNVTESASSQHHLVVEQLMDYVTSEVGLQKAHVLAKRDEIIAGLE